MGKVIFIVSWAVMVGASASAAFWTGRALDQGVEAIANIAMVKGQVFSRREAVSIFNQVAAGDPVANGDFVSTAARSEAEVRMEDGTVLLVQEKSLIQIRLSGNDSGLTSELVTLLKGDLVAKTSTKPRRDRPAVALKSGSGPVQMVSSGSEVKVSQDIQTGQSVIRVLQGQATVQEDNKPAKVLTPGQQVTRTAPVVPVATPGPQLASLQVPELPQAAVLPEKFLSSDRLIREKIHTRVAARNEPVAVIPPAPANPPPKTAAVSKPAAKMPEKSTPPPPEKTIETAPPKPLFEVTQLQGGVTSGPGIYLVRGGRLVAKITGKVTPADLDQIARQNKSDFIFKGNAQALSGKVSVAGLKPGSTLWLARDGQVISLDADLLRSRPSTISLIQGPGAVLFREKVEIMKFGH